MRRIRRLLACLPLLAGAGCAADAVAGPAAAPAPQSEAQASADGGLDFWCATFLGPAPPGWRPRPRSTGPLYIVDGAPLAGRLDRLSLDDVESLEVLKGPAAAALYGARGANGVIIVTTRAAR